MGILFDKISVIVAGVEHQLDGNAPYGYLGSDGLGAAPLQRLTERGAMQHGETDYGYRLDPRVFSLLLIINADNTADFWDQRSDLITWFAPYYAPTMRFELKNGNIRHIDCFHVGDLIMPDADFQGTVQRLAIQLKAPDPTFYDPEVRSITFGLAGGGDAFLIPTEIPHGIGASTLDQSIVISNSGNWLAYPHQIRITGPITDAVITNSTTDEKLDFTGTTIAGGDYYDIDVRPGHKSVVDSTGVNRVGNLSADSDLGTWHLMPGDNSISVTGSSVTETTEAEIGFFEHYLGV